MDRNEGFFWWVEGDRLSLSARRAWIEIDVDSASGILSDVALRKESVDRNHVRYTASPRPSMSLSARRAWIEIPAGCWRDARRAVALRKESVDRNLWWGVRKAVGSRRSPQGERG